MNREIKFRGRDERGYWHIGWLVETNDGRIYIAENDEGWTDDGFHNDDFSGWYNVLEKNRWTIHWFARQKRRGNLRGDILHIPEDTFNAEINGIVKWDTDGFFVESLRSGCSSLLSWALKKRPCDKTLRKTYRGYRKRVRQPRTN